MAEKETIYSIAQSIDDYVQFRKQYNERSVIARSYVTYKDTLTSDEERDEVFFLTNVEHLPAQFRSGWTGGVQTVVSTNRGTYRKAKVVYKNTKMGEVLSKFWQGKHSYSQLTKTKRLNEIKVDIHNRTTFDHLRDDILDLEFRFAGDDNFYRHASLKQLLNEARSAQEKAQQKLVDAQAEQKRADEEAAALKERERIAREKAQEAERQRLEQERIAKEQEAQDRRKEAERLEQSIANTQEHINFIKSFLRTSVSLRSQHILDEYQESAKRSHIFDGVPIVINGGPGTGKTTTIIQRLKFLLSAMALDEYDNPLTREQKQYLTNPDTIKDRWIFFSPTKLLLQYLKENMSREGLTIVEDQNVKTIERFRHVKMREYGLCDPVKDGPFKEYKDFSNTLIKEPTKAVTSFEHFCIDFIYSSMQKRVAMKTENFSWHKRAESIKATFASGKVNDIDGLMRLLNALKDRERINVQVIDQDLSVIIGDEAIKIKRLALENQATVDKIKHLFEQWHKERELLNDDDDEDITNNDEDEENDTLQSFNQQEFDAQVYATLRKLLRKLGLKKYDTKTKLSKRDESFYELIKPYIQDEAGIQTIGELAWFTKNFASMCRGLESCLISQLPKLYKAYRKHLLATESKIYDLVLLKELVNKDNNKHLHFDEQDLLLGFINNMFYKIYHKSRNRFNELKNKYIVAYKESVRPVITIDEATDYTLLDYYMMSSFKHYDFSSITLCGDILQGLNSNGIQKWAELSRTFLPNLEVKDLNISYRQLPPLVDLSREMYKDDQGQYPEYASDRKYSEDDPKPLLYISDDEDDKAQWIGNRIVDINKSYGSLPSIAIFVGEDVDIPEFIERIEDYGNMSGIQIVDCSGNRNLDSKEVVRVFRLSEVKGMEFEAVFFYDIDKAIGNRSSKLMRRHLYVGVSRATSHLAATMTTSRGNESIIKYFNTELEYWN